MEIAEKDWSEDRLRSKREVLELCEGLYSSGLRKRPSWLLLGFRTWLIDLISKT
jgi:hypothetical protein